jgi:hypothetical protein
MLAPAAPHGYPHLGLSAVSLPLRYRRDANLTRLARRLETWESDRGNDGFEARNLSNLSPATAFELVHVYVALRERHPSVMPAYVNFSTDLDGGKSLAWAYSYPQLFPALRGHGDEHDCARDERQGEQWGFVHLERSGAIELDSLFSSPLRYNALIAYWQKRNANAARRGRPPRTKELLITPAAYVLMHEYAHLIDGELTSAGWQRAEPVYRALSKIVFHVEPTVTQWRYHLINYPSLYQPGPHQGNKQRQRSNKQAVRPSLGHLLGSYAAHSRDEAFAEAFALAHGSSKPLRTELAPLLRALSDDGVRRRRRG